MDILGDNAVYICGLAILCLAYVLYSVSKDCFIHHLSC